MWNESTCDSPASRGLAMSPGSRRLFGALGVALSLAAVLTVAACGGAISQSPGKSHRQVKLKVDDTDARLGALKRGVSAALTASDFKEIYIVAPGASRYGAGVYGIVDPATGSGFLPLPVGGSYAIIARALTHDGRVFSGIADSGRVSYATDDPIEITIRPNEGPKVDRLSTDLESGVYRVDATDRSGSGKIIFFWGIGYIPESYLSGEEAAESTGSDRAAQAEGLSTKFSEAQIGSGGKVVASETVERRVGSRRLVLGLIIDDKGGIAPYLMGLDLAGDFSSDAAKLAKSIAPTTPEDIGMFIKEFFDANIVCVARDGEVDCAQDLRIQNFVSEPTFDEENGKSIFTVAKKKSAPADIQIDSVKLVCSNNDADAELTNCEVALSPAPDTVDGEYYGLSLVELEVVDGGLRQVDEAPAYLDASRAIGWADIKPLELMSSATRELRDNQSGAALETEPKPRSESPFLTLKKGAVYSFEVIVYKKGKDRKDENSDGWVADLTAVAVLSSRVSVERVFSGLEQPHVFPYVSNIYYIDDIVAEDGRHIMVDVEEPEPDYSGYSVEFADSAALTVAPDASSARDIEFRIGSVKLSCAKQATIGSMGYISDCHVVIDKPKNAVDEYYYAIRFNRLIEQAPRGYAWTSLWADDLGKRGRDARRDRLSPGLERNLVYGYDLGDLYDLGFSADAGEPMRLLPGEKYWLTVTAYKAEKGFVDASSDLQPPELVKRLTNVGVLEFAFEVSSSSRVGPIRFAASELKPDISYSVPEQNGGPLTATLDIEKNSWADTYYKASWEPSTSGSGDRLSITRTGADTAFGSFDITASNGSFEFEAVDKSFYDLDIYSLDDDNLGALVHSSRSEDVKPSVHGALPVENYAGESSKFRIFVKFHSSDKATGVTSVTGVMSFDVEVSKGITHSIKLSPVASEGRSLADDGSLPDIPFDGGIPADRAGLRDDTSSLRAGLGFYEYDNNFGLSKGSKFILSTNTNMYSLSPSSFYFGSVTFTLGDPGSTDPKCVLTVSDATADLWAGGSYKHYDSVYAVDGDVADFSWTSSGKVGFGDAGDVAFTIPKCAFKVGRHIVDLKVYEQRASDANALPGRELANLSFDLRKYEIEDDNGVTTYQYGLPMVEYFFAD